MPVKKYATLLEYMEATECSQSDLAKRLRITQGFLSLLLNGYRTPSLAMAVRIEDLAGVPARAWIKNAVTKKAA